jgi:hypothetical protein
LETLARLIRKRRDDDNTVDASFLASLWKECNPDVTTLRHPWREQEEMRRWIRNCNLHTLGVKPLLGLSNNGDLDVCPKNTRESDIVVALDGELTPFILRPSPSMIKLSDDDQLRKLMTYQLVGDCCLDGWMTGDQLTDLHRQDMLQEDPLNKVPWANFLFNQYMSRRLLEKVFSIDGEFWPNSVLNEEC